MLYSCSDVIPLEVFDPVFDPVLGAMLSAVVGAMPVLGYLDAIVLD